MADSMDLVQEHVANELARNLAKATRRTAQVSEFFCSFCNSEIPEARRRAVIGVSTCVGCQSVAESKKKHYNGGAV